MLLAFTCSKHPRWRWAHWKLKCYQGVPNQPQKRNRKGAVLIQFIYLSIFKPLCKSKEERELKNLRAKIIRIINVNFFQLFSGFVFFPLHRCWLLFTRSSFSWSVLLDSAWLFYWCSVQFVFQDAVQAILVCNTLISFCGEY